MYVILMKKSLRNPWITIIGEFKKMQKLQVLMEFFFFFFFIKFLSDPNYK